VTGEGAIFRTVQGAELYGRPGVLVGRGPGVTDGVGRGPGMTEGVGIGRKIISQAATIVLSG
jgi:hypothetical protein